MVSPRRAQNLLLLFSAVGIAVGACEGALRLVYRAPWYMALLGEQSRNERLPYRLNRLGLRDRDYPAAKPVGSRRVFVIGDSFTFGLGVRDDAAIMPELLERQLNATGRRVELLNGGVSGSLTTDWVRLMDRVYPVFHPDVVLVVFFLRDGTRTDVMKTFFVPIRKQIAQRNAASLVYRYSYIYRVVRDVEDRKLVASRYAASLTASYAGTSEETAEWQLAKRNLLDLTQFARAHGARLALAVYPALADLDRPVYPFQTILDSVTAFANRNAIPVHNMLDGFRGEAASSLWVSSYDQHPNARGHAIAAASLLPFVGRQLDAGRDTVTVRVLP